MNKTKTITDNADLENIHNNHSNVVYLFKVSQEMFLTKHHKAQNLVKLNHAF